VKANMNRTKVLVSGESRKGVQNARRWPCGVCGRGVGRNSIQCTKCQKWVHKKCSGVTASVIKVSKTFVFKSRGRPKKTSSDVLEKDCETRQLPVCKEDAMDHTKWRKLIKNVV